jgi:hypothetical protein
MGQVRTATDSESEWASSTYILESTERRLAKRKREGEGRSLSGDHKSMDKLEYQGKASEGHSHPRKHRGRVSLVSKAK